MLVKAALVVLAVAAAGLGWLSLAERRRGLAQVEEIEKAKAVENELRARLSATERERDQLRTAQGSPPPREAPIQRPVPTPPKIGADDPVTRRELVRLLNEKNEKVAAAERAISEFQERLHATDTKLADASQKALDLEAAERQLRERLDAATRVAEAFQKEARGREARLAQLEVTNQDLRRRGADAGRQAERLSRLAAEMAGIERRREAYVTGILRRYREVTDLYRSLARRLESGPEGQVSTGISRIHSAISLADEDLRQLQLLNAEATRLQRELVAVK